MDAGGRFEKQALAGRQAVAADQPAHPRQRAVCHLSNAEGFTARHVEYQLGLDRQLPEFLSAAASIARAALSMFLRRSSVSGSPTRLATARWSSSATSRRGLPP